MAKHNHKEAQEGSVAVAEPETQVVEQAQPVQAEEPKTKVGDKPGSTTTVDAAEKKPRAQRIPKGAGTFRLLDGVDAAKYTGQRGCVIRALQSLKSEQGDQNFTLDQIVGKTEGLVSRTPIEASVLYHLKAMVQDKMVEFTPAPAPAAAAAPAKTEGQAA